MTDRPNSRLCIFFKGGAEADAHFYAATLLDRETAGLVQAVIMGMKKINIVAMHSAFEGLIA